MKELFLLDGVYDLQEAAEKAKFSDALVAVWDQGTVPEGIISIPVALDQRLLEIRSELLAWVYETGVTEIQGQSLEKHLRAGDSLSMWWLSTLAEKHPKVTHHLFEVLKLRVLEKIINEQGITKIVLYDHHCARPCASGPSTPADLLAETLDAFCIATGRSFFRENASKSDPRHFCRTSAKEFFKNQRDRIYYALPAIVKAALRYPLWWWKIRKYLPKTTQTRPNVAHPATIVTYFPNIDPTAARNGRFRSRYWENLHDALNTEEPQRVNWVFIHFPAPQYSFIDTIALRDRFRKVGKDGASFHFLEEFLSTKDLFRVAWRYLKLVLVSFRIENEVQKLFFFSGSKMPLWGWLKDNWADSTRGWRALERCLMALAFRRYVAWAGSQEWTIFPQENCPWERMLSQAMHEANAGSVYGAQHSTVRPTDFRYFDDPRLIHDPSCRLAMPDIWLCNGSGAYNALLSAGFPKEKLDTVEALRYLYLEKKSAKQEKSEKTKNQENQEKEKQDIDTQDKKLLIVTSFFADEVEAHLNLLAKASAAGVLNGWQVLIKAHPYLPVAPYLQRLFPEESGNMPQTVEGAISTFLVPHTVVWASNSTTVALEAAWCGLPVLVQAAENDLSLCPLQNLLGVCSVRSVADVAAALKHPSVPDLPSDYLLLDSTLPRWKKLLKLNN